MTEERPEEAPVRLSLPQLIATAISLQKANATEAAEAIYRGVLAVAPDHPDALQFLGMIQHGRGEREQAVATLKKAAEIAPENASIWNNLGNALIEIRQSEQAAAAYRRALDAAPDFAAPHNNLGAIHRSRGEDELAESAYRRAIELDPNFADAWRNLSNLHLALGRVKQAVECGLRAVALSPRSTLTLQHSGIAYAYLGDLAKAADVFRSWLAKEPENAVAQHHLAACEGKNAPERASDAYVSATFDAFAKTFESKLETLGYRAPRLVADALKSAWRDKGKPASILDAGCGTGLCGRELRAIAGTLLGVDLSAGMLAEAERAGVYDELVQAELGAFLGAQRSRFDAIVSADTLCYFGALEEFASAAFDALAPGGLLVFTVEALGDEQGFPYRLHPNGRYAHRAAYIKRVFSGVGFRIARIGDDVLRMECNVPVGGLIVTAERPAS